MLRMLELFAGIGGAGVAAHKLGILTTQFVEINPDAQLVLRSHFPNIPIHDDIKTYHPSPGKFDIIWNSFPCTGTSNAGGKQGLSHPASSLWRKGLRCLIEARPKFCIIEQPEGIIRQGLHTILGGLRMAGYASEVGLVQANWLGAGHRRRRVFIISYPDQWADKFKNASCWSNQMRKLVEEERLNSSWLTVRNEGDRSDDGLSVQLVRGSTSKELKQEDYVEPNKTPGRIRARYLAGRTVTPPQAAIALKRVLYLNSLIDQKKIESNLDCNYSLH